MYVCMYVCAVHVCVCVDLPLEFYLGLVKGRCGRSEIAEATLTLCPSVCVCVCVVG